MGARTLVTVGLLAAATAACGGGEADAGDAVLVVLAPGEGGDELVVHDVGGEELRRVVAPDDVVALHPVGDADRLLVRAGGGDAVHLVETDTGTIHQVDVPDGWVGDGFPARPDPARPDQEVVVLTGTDEVVVVDAETADAVTVPAPGATRVFVADDSRHVLVDDGTDTLVVSSSDGEVERVPGVAPAGFVADTRFVTIDRATAAVAMRTVGGSVDEVLRDAVGGRAITPCGVKMLIEDLGTGEWGEYDAAGHLVDPVEAPADGEVVCVDGGGTALVGSPASGWTSVDMGGRATARVDVAAGSTPVVGGPGQRLVPFAPVEGGSALDVLDVGSGAVRRVELPGGAAARATRVGDGSRVAVVSSPTGEAVVVDLASGTARPAGGAAAAVAPTDRHLAVGPAAGAGTAAPVRIAPLDDPAAGVAVGDGTSFAWVRAG